MLRQCAWLSSSPLGSAVLTNVAHFTVKGGGKVGHVGGSIVGLRLSLSSEKDLANWPAKMMLL